MISYCGCSVRNVFAIVSPQGRAARMMLTNMDEIFIRSSRGEATVLAHKDLGAPLAVGILLPHPMDLPQVGLQGAALSEGFLTELTPIWPNALQQGTQDSDQTGLLRWTHPQVTTVHSLSKEKQDWLGRITEFQMDGTGTKDSASE